MYSSASAKKETKSDVDADVRGETASTKTKFKIRVTDGGQFARQFLKHYLENGMGAMTKRDVDILVMHLICQHAKLPKRTNHFLSINLQVTESQVRRLRYEADLKYPPEEPNYVEIQFLKILANSKFVTEKEKHRIVFLLEDDYLRYEIQSRLKDRGMFADSSFNSEIVKMNIDAFKTLIYDMYGKDTARKFVDEIKKISKTKDYEELKKVVIETALSTLVGTVAATTINSIKVLVGIPL